MSPLDETMKSKFNLYPVQDEVESILLENIEGNTFKQNILNYAFGKMPIKHTEKIPYVFNAAYGFCIKLEDFLRFVYKHEYPEIINSHLTPINLQIPNISLFSHLIVQYLNNSQSKLFPGYFPYQSIPIENINSTLYILNHISKYIDEVPPYIYYTQYFLQGNFNPMLNQTPMQIKAPERKILNYVPAYRPTIQQLMNKIDPEFIPSTSKSNPKIISTSTTNNIKSESIEVLETYNTTITKEQLKLLIEKSRDVDTLRQELTHQKEINKQLESQIKEHESNEIVFEKVYDEMRKEKELYFEQRKEQEKIIIKQQSEILNLSVELNIVKIRYEECKLKVEEQEVQLVPSIQANFYNKQLHEIISTLEKQHEILIRENGSLKEIINKQKEDIAILTKQEKEYIHTINTYKNNQEELEQKYQDKQEELLQEKNKEIINKQKYEETLMVLLNKQKELLQQIEILSKQVTILQLEIQNKAEEISLKKIRIEEQILRSEKDQKTIKKYQENEVILSNTIKEKDTLIERLTFDNDVLTKEKETNTHLINQTDIKLGKLLESNRILSQEILQIKSNIQDKDIEITQLKISKDELNSLKEYLSNKQQVLNRTLIEHIKHNYNKDIEPFANMFKYQGKFYIISNDKLYQIDISKLAPTEILTLP